MNSNVKNVKTPLNPSASGVAGKIRAPALPAAVKKAKSSYRHFHLLPPVRVRTWEALQPHNHVHQHQTAVFRELDLCSRALY